MDYKRENIKLIRKCRKEEMVPAICPSCGFPVGATAKDGMLNFFSCPACKARWSRIDDPLKD